MGSPPLAWGIHVHSWDRIRWPGLTPARAGNTSTATRRTCLTGAHPRSRGEYIFIYSSTLQQQGSPPLARGIPDVPGRRAAKLRLTPARAGNTSCPYIPGWSRRAHPRSRGEYAYTSIATLPTKGSPPLARGIQYGLMYQLDNYGLTPARAGNTHGVEYRPFAMKAHPRSRGEYWDVVHIKTWCTGSPPLARGILVAGCFICLDKWLTPARAGNTFRHR